MSDVGASEPVPLQRGGSGLRRSLSGFATTAMTFSSCGASAGLYSLFGFSLGAAGTAFFWGWPLVAIGVLFMCLVFAELASHYPYAGAMYQWPTFVLNRRVGWWIGWMYLFAICALLTAYYFILPLTIEPLFGIESTTAWNVGIALGALAFATGINVLGIRILGRFTELGVIAELLIMVVITTAVLIFGATQSPAILFDLSGSGATFGPWLPGFLGGGMFVSLWVLYTFENAGTLGEETVDAARRAPWAVLGAFGGSVLLGLYFLFAMIIAIPSIPAITNSGQPLVDIINNALPNWVSKVYLILISEVIILGANITFTAAARQFYGMARDNQLPFSRQLAKTKDGTPWVAILVVAVITGLPFIASTEIIVLITGATAAMYVTYFALMVAVLYARLRGWPRENAPFSLGKWGTPINVLAVAASGAFMLNLLWFRDSTNPRWHLDLPVAIWLVGVPLIVGVVYYVLVQRRRLSEAEASPLGAEAPPPGSG